ncbi:MAG: hypothetical protein VB141_09265 [Burkholderia gladioli]
MVGKKGGAALFLAGHDVSISESKAGPVEPPCAALSRHERSTTLGATRARAGASSADGERFPELKALALYFLDDPLWRGIAQGLADDANPHVATAMRKLLEDAPGRHPPAARHGHPQAVPSIHFAKPWRPLRLSLIPARRK